MSLDINILIGGAAGQGVHAITGPLAKALVRHGLRVHVTQSYQSRIRGGHLYNLIRVSDLPLLSGREGVEILVALNQETVDLHAAELSSEGILVSDASEVPRLPSGRRAVVLAPEALLPETGAAEIAINAGAAGAILGLLGVPVAGLQSLLADTFADKGEQVVSLNRQAAAAGHRLGAEAGGKISLGDLPPPPEPYLILTGHEGLAVGALAAGVNFICGYPMTPWTSLFNALSQRAQRWQVLVEQTEDEIAAINMAIGAAFAGARALTGTSGGGFCLMTEGVGLAAMTETPVVVVVAQRPGPSTGLPTRTSQGDLEFVLHAGQDTFPRAVLAPGTPPQGYRAAVRAFSLAEKYQTPVFILTDQYFADAQFTCTAAEFPPLPAPPAPEQGAGSPAYQRYEITESGISPRRIPGFGPELVVADSDEHTPDGHLTEDLTVRVRMHEKRLRKLEGMAREMHGVTVTGDLESPLAFLTWGSSYGPVAEAAARHGKARMVHLSELWPFPQKAVGEALRGVQKLIAVEANAGGQLGRLLRRETGRLPDHFILRYDGLPFTPEYILRRLPGETG